MRPVLLDLFCGAGGAATGYYRAGFDIVGVDIAPQRRYPFDFIQADALDVLEDPPPGIAAIHASPPCQAYSATRSMWNARHGHPDLVPAVRSFLAGSGVPWVIENVPGAPVESHVVLCGTMFGLVDGGWELRRHRLFETSGFWCLTPPCQHNGPVVGVYGGHARDRRRTLGVYGNGGANTAGHNAKGSTALISQARRLMGIDWMTTKEISQAIPPAYTEHLGRALLDNLALTPRGVLA